ncbi:MAG: NAD(P)-dependent oxidoreductase [Candidatus Eremiobacteraeota bacterium]|nr:NAD(P)-dependent oxidoreductase [Candidatus Eremiobacteraeota bacterium]MBV9407601.1 NAD(P)-dependent oxidoreductase [Candidatus Eremiobacteraeota bacterium]
MSKIAITGAAGLVGTYLSADLARDHAVVRIDLHDADVVADVQDLAALERAFAGCETVVHLAGISSVTATWEQVHGANIAGTYNAYEAARRQGVRRVIFASSNHAVGMHEIVNGAPLYEPGAGVLVRNDDPFRADSLYGAGKAFGEVLGKFYSERFGLQVTCVRIGSIVEPDRYDDPSLFEGAGFLDYLNADERRKRYASTWMSQRDFARLVRAIMARDVDYAVVYGVSDNATRFWDLEPGRAIFGFWPLDGARTTKPS